MLRASAPCVAALIALLIAVYVWMPWPFDLHVPFAIGGDASSSLYLFKTILEHGSYLQNPDVGAPFGATMYDYPIPEPTHRALIRLIGWFTRDPFVAHNLFYLFSYASAAFAACWALRRLGIGWFAAVAGAVAFALLPYHFLRLPHIFLASYAAAPVIGYYAMQLATFRAPHISGSARVGWGPVLALATAAGMGVYYAFFGMLFLALAALIGFAKSGQRMPLRIGAVYVATVVAVIGFSLLPNMLYHMVEGANPLVAARSPIEADIYGLRISQLLLPTPGHRFPLFDALTVWYGAHAANVNENSTAALGIIGSIGFLIALAAFFFMRMRKHPSLWVAGAMCVAAVLYATIGGFGVIFSLLVTPEIRGLNRISVFIAFFALYAFFSATGLIFAHLRRRGLAEVLLAIAVVAVACFDQIPKKGLVRRDVAGFAKTKALFARIRAALPDHAAVFELPHMYFPESPAPPALGSYYLFDPYLFTNGLRWSFGDMRGRPSETWSSQVADLRGDELANALATAGFSAIYVDRRGYADRGAAVEKDLRAKFGAPIVEDVTLGRALYRVPVADAHAQPYVAVELGRGWDGWKKVPSSKDETSTAARDSELVVANPTDAPVGLLIQFDLTATTARKITFSYGDEIVSTRSLDGGQPTSFAVPITSRVGISRLQIQTAPLTNMPSPAGSTTPSIRIENLAWAVARKSH